MARQVTESTTAVESTTVTDVDTARITMRFPRPTHTNDDGDTVVTKVRFAIDVRPAGDTDYTTQKFLRKMLV